VSYTFISAAWADAAQTAVVAQTVEAGAVLVSESEHPLLWAALVASSVSISSFAYSSAALLDYANAKYTAQMAGGVSIDGVWVSTTGGGRVDMLGAVSLAQLAPEHVFDWVNGATIIQLSAAQVIALGLAVGAWVQDNYTVLGAVRAGIAAENITTTAEIDAAAWPSNT
jgi:hypothetical protein